MHTMRCDTASGITIIIEHNFLAEAFLIAQPSLHVFYVAFLVVTDGVINSLEMLSHLDRTAEAGTSLNFRHVVKHVVRI